MIVSMVFSDDYVFMLYNGNNYGYDSLGWAVAKK